MRRTAQSMFRVICREAGRVPKLTTEYDVTWLPQLNVLVYKDTSASKFSSLRALSSPSPS
ncbi:hypothetical protein FA95DRAFT_1552841, partial [Auriscalpium vulgare]